MLEKSGDNLSIDIKVPLKDEVYDFTYTASHGEILTIDVGEQILASKLFHVLAGLDKDYEGVITDSAGKVDFSHTAQNNVLALGDRTMFLNGTVYKNIYRALRTRHTRQDAKQKVYKLQELFQFDLKASIKNLTCEELLKVALARSYYREIALVIINKCETFIAKDIKICLPNCDKRYIIEIV